MAEIYKDKTCKELFYAHLIKEGLYQFKNSEEDWEKQYAILSMAVNLWLVWFKFYLNHVHCAI